MTRGYWLRQRDRAEAESAKVKALTGKEANKAEDRKGTMAYSIMEAHNTSGKYGTSEDPV